MLAMRMACLPAGGEPGPVTWPALCSSRVLPRVYCGAARMLWAWAVGSAPCLREGPAQLEREQTELLLPPLRNWLCLLSLSNQSHSLPWNEVHGGGEALGRGRSAGAVASWVWPPGLKAPLDPCLGQVSAQPGWGWCRQGRCWPWDSPRGCLLPCAQRPLTPTFREVSDASITFQRGLPLADP